MEAKDTIRSSTLLSTNTKMENTEQAIIIEEKISKINGEISVRKYAKGKMLGKGGFAKVFEVTNLESKKSLAGKIIQKNSLTKNRARQKLISEIKIHKSLHHHNVVQFEHVFEDQENVYILLEVCCNQTLNELLKRRKKLHELEVQCYVLQIITALKYLHSNRVIHRDLKLGNLFLNDKLEIKIGDFGLATKLDYDGEKKKTVCGTPNYIAPEVLDGKCGHSYEVDVWSLGVIIYTLIIGKPPFETPDVKTTYKKIKMNSYAFPDHTPISDSARNLISKILVLDPTKRPTLDEMLASPFLSNVTYIPKNLPLSTLACPPSTSFLKQYLPQGSNMLRSSQSQQKMFETAPNTQFTKGFSKERVSNVQSTDNLKSFKPPGSAATVLKTDQNANNIAETVGGSSNNFVSTQNNYFKDQNKGSTGYRSEVKALNSMKSIPSGNNFPNTVGMSSVNNFNRTKTLSTNNIMANNTARAQEIWVKKWVDYSGKYGLGYLLSNGATGVYFNDSTKIILDPKGTYFEYFEKKGADNQDIVCSYHLNNFPANLQKKVTLLQHFRSYLEGDTKQKPIQDENEAEDAQKTQPLNYVKKWMKTKHAIMFRLSNKIVQVNFTDKTEIILSSENKTVTYVNKKGEKTNYPLQTALESSNQEMTKRLKYTKEILTHMLNANNANTIANNPAPQFNDHL